MTYEPGELHELEGWYRLESGLVRRYRLTEQGAKVTVALLFPGDVFEVRPYHERHEDDEVLIAAELTPWVFDVGAAYSNLKVQFERLVAQAELNGWSLETRLLCWLRQLAPVVGTAKEGGALIPLTQEQLAILVGVKRESVTKVLGVLKAERYLATTYGGVVFYD